MRRSSLAVDAGLFILIVLVPLAWTKLFIAEFTLAKLVTLNAALALAACGAAAIPRVIAAGRTALDIPLAAGLCVIVLSAVLSDDPMTSLRGRYDSYAYGAWGLALAAASYQLAARGARGREEEAARWLVWSAAAVGGYAILQKLGIDPIFHIKELPTGGRAVSTLGSPVDLGAFLALLWPMALRRVDAERGALSSVLAVLVAGGLIASGSRGAMFAAAAGSVCYWLLSRREPRTALPRSVGAAALAVAFVLAWSLRSGASVRDLARREVWKTASAAFQLRPWLGWGPDGFEDMFKLLRSDRFVELLGSSSYQAYAHNDLLHVLSGTGLLGAAAYAWLLVALCLEAKRALQSAPGRGRAAALFAGLLALWVNLALNPVALEVTVLAAVCAGLLVSVAAPPEPRVPARLPLAVLAALACVSLVHAAGLSRADAAYKRGAKAQAARDFAAARADIARARRAAPCELYYITGEVNALGDWINATRDIPERLALLALGDADAGAAVSCHPKKSMSHYVAASVSRMHADLGFRDRLPQAVLEFDRALALDPKFEPLLNARREAARLAPSPR
jgi:O-antigen ligase